jgi:hypothetical protein
MDKVETVSVFRKVNLHIVIGFLPCSVITTSITFCLFHLSPGILFHVNFYFQQDLAALKHPESHPVDMETITYSMSFGCGFFVYLWVFNHQ